MAERGARRRFPLLLWPASAIIVAFAGWCVWLVMDVRNLRGAVEAHVGALVDVRAATDLATTTAPQSRDWATIDGRLERASTAVDSADVREAMAGLRRAMDAARAADERGEPQADTHDAVIKAQSDVVRTLRVRTGEVSARLGERWTALYLVVGAALVLATANLVLLVVAFRRRGQAESRGERLAEQMDILERTAAAIADGDIAASVDGDSRFAATLERIRAGLVDKIEALDGRNRENDELNRELRHQIAERSRELEDALMRLRGDGIHPEVGHVIAERYRVLAPLGTGAHGRVYRVAREPDGRELALKVLKQVDNQRVVQRFVHEAGVLAGIRHPNVIAIHDVGVSPDGRLYLATELVEGENLEDLERRYRDLGWAQPILAGVASGLAAVHAEGIVHRDVKPSNIVVPRATDGPRAKLIDFGVARLNERESSDRVVPVTPPGAATADTVSAQRTRMGVVVGTPRYLAPEVATGSSEPSPAADVFALGVTCYLVLTGRPPFTQPPMTLLARYGELPAPTPLAALHTAIDADVAAAVTRSMAVDPDARPTAADLAAALAVRE